MAIILFVMLSLGAWAQDVQTQGHDLDLVEAVSIINQTLFPDLNPCDASDRLSLSDDRVEFATILSEQENPPRLFKIRFDSMTEVPAELRYLAGEAFERAGDGEVDFVFKLPNDNLGMGMWSLLTKSKSGDDDSLSHGAQFEIGKQIKALYWRLEGNTTIYTKTVSQTRNEDGERTRHKYFTEENAIRLVVDNMRRNKSFYYEAGVGWRELNSENVRPLLAGWQMQHYHDLFADYDSDLTYRVNFVPKPDMPRDSGFEGFVGLGAVRDTILQGGRVRIRSLGRVRLHVGELQDSDYVSANAESTAYIQKRADGVAWRVGTGVETAKGRYVDQTFARVDVGVARNNGALTLSASRALSEGGPHSRPRVISPVDDDTLWTMEFRCKVHRSQRCRPFEGLVMGRMRR